MAKKGKARRDAGKGRDRVWVCRGCCCGTDKKHPEVPHDELARIAKQGAREAGFKFSITDCLGPCGRGNIVVVRSAGRVRWFEKMNDERSTRALVDHLAARGTLADLPSRLARRVMRKRDDRKPKD